MKLGSIVELVKETFRQFGEDKATRLAGALAYSSIFSLAPLLIIVIAIAGAVFGEEAARGQIVTQIRGMVGTAGAVVIEDMIQNAGQQESGLLATAVSVVTLLIGVSGVFLALQDSLNTIWGVMPAPGGGIKYMIRSRLLSFTLVISIGFLLLIALVVDAALSGVNNFLTERVGGLGILLQIFNQVLSIGVTTALFAIIFKYLPDVKIGWRDVALGALATAILFTIGKFLIGLYIGNGSVGSVYGAAGSLVVLLVWIYYSALILFLGAEFTQVYATRFGSHLQPAEGAIPLTPEARARQGIPLAGDVRAATDYQDARTK